MTSLATKSEATSRLLKSQTASGQSLFGPLMTVQMLYSSQVTKPTRFVGMDLLEHVEVLPLIHLVRKLLGHANEGTLGRKVGMG